MNSNLFNSSPSDNWGTYQELLAHMDFVYSDLVVVGLASYITRKWEGDPLWILITAPPSTGKTAALTLLSKATETHFVSSLTPASLITAWGGADTDRSMMAKLDGKLLVVKDFGTILSMGWESCGAVLSILREAYDGYVKKDFAMLTREYHLRFNVVAACTPTADAHAPLSQQLGERFLKYRPKPVLLPYPRKPLNNELPMVTSQFVDSLNGIDIANNVHDDKIQSAASLAAQLRTIPHHDIYHGEIDEFPEVEQPHRLSFQLDRLYRAIRIITNDVDYAMKIALQTALDSVPLKRLHIFKIVFYEGWITTHDVMARSRVGHRSTDLVLKDFEMLGLLEKHLGGFPKENYWRVPPDLYEHIIEVFEHF